MNDWTVWVGGGEVNDNYLTEDKAKELAIYFIADGYGDVVIQNLSDDKNYQLNNNKWEKVDVDIENWTCQSGT